MKILKFNKEFEEKAGTYKPLDGVLALGLFLIFCLLYAFLAVLQSTFSFIKQNITAAGCVFNILMILTAVLFVKIKKEKLSTIGLYKGRWKLSCVIGLVIAFVLFFNNCLWHIIGGAAFIPAKDIIKLTFYYLTVSLSEEIIFRGYISTRLHGILKNSYLVILVSGILFVIMHFPYRMIAYSMTIGDLTINNLSWIIDLFVTHTVLSIIYFKTNSLYGSIIPHWMSNLAYNLVVR